MEGECSKAGHKRPLGPGGLWVPDVQHHLREEAEEGSKGPLVSHLQVVLQTAQSQVETGGPALQPPVPGLAWLLMPASVPCL